MQNPAIYIISKNQTTGIWIVIRIIFYNFSGCNSFWILPVMPSSFLWHTDFQYPGISCADIILILENHPWYLRSPRVALPPEKCLPHLFRQQHLTLLRILPDKPKKLLIYWKIQTFSMWVKIQIKQLNICRDFSLQWRIFRHRFHLCKNRQKICSDR